MLPLLALSFGQVLAYEYISNKNSEMKDKVLKEDFSLLPLLHHFTSGMKAVFTQDALEGLYVIRQSVGGAGFTEWSGIPYLISIFNNMVTVEGDNTVMA